MAKKMQNNFITQLQQDEKKQRSSAAQSNRMLFLPAALVAVVCLVAFGVIFSMSTAVHAQVVAVEGWCNDSSNAAAYQESMEHQNTYRNNQSAVLGLQTASDLLASYPDADSDVLNRIRAAGGDTVTVVFKSYDSATGTLAFDAQSAAVIDIPAYVRMLESTGLFANVGYTGYGYTKDGTYAINLTCTLAAPAEGGAQ